MNKLIVGSTIYIATIAIYSLLIGSILSFLLIISAALLIAQLDEPFKQWILNKIRKPKLEVPKVTKGLSIGLAVFLFLVGAGFQASESPISSDQFNSFDNRPEIATAEAQEYSIIDADDTGFRGRSRIQAFILSPKANTPETLASTARKAAIEILETRDAQYIQVFIEPVAMAVGFGFSIAEATYVPDGCGLDGTTCGGQVMRVSVIKELLNDEEQNILSLWFNNRERYMRNGTVNETLLSEYVSRETGIPVLELTLPFKDKVEVYSSKDKQTL